MPLYKKPPEPPDPCSGCDLYNRKKGSWLPCGGNVVGCYEYDIYRAVMAERKRW